MPFELRIALRYLKARRKQAFISLISGVSILGVAVGVMALMISLGLMTGLQGELRSRILGATAHLSIFRSEREPIDGYMAVIERIRKLPRVRGAAPAIYGKGLIASGVTTLPVTMKGVLPAMEPNVTELATQVENGSLAVLEKVASGPAPILLGTDLAANLGVQVGDVVSVTSPNGRLSPWGVLPRVTKFRVAGTVRSGLFEFDAEWSYISLDAAQQLFDMQPAGEAGTCEVDCERATLVEVRIDDMYAVGEAGREIVAALGPDYATNDWIQMNQSLFSALWLEKVAIGITIGLIVMVAALNIVATLILMVMEKHKDIAILVSMGASRGAIARVFMLQGTLIGAIGTATGATLGWAACRVLDHYKLIQVPVDVYQVPYVPFKLQAGDASLVIVGALLVCFLATIYPARGAARLDPAEALRNE
jgi:lipoprotein-releasing system permease protein